MKIANLTQHDATPEQLAAGVTEHSKSVQNIIKRNLTFNSLPSKVEINNSASKLAELAAYNGCKAAMIGGAPFLMPALEQALRLKNIQPLYAFSKRETLEQALEDGTTKKVSFFKHVGFIEA